MMTAMCSRVVYTYAIRQGFNPMIWRDPKILSVHWKRKENPIPFLPGIPSTNMVRNIFPVKLLAAGVVHVLYCLASSDILRGEQPCGLTSS